MRVIMNAIINIQYMKTLITSLLMFFAVSCGEQTKKDIIIKKKSTPLSDQEIKKQGYQIKKNDTFFIEN